MKLDNLNSNKIFHLRIKFGFQRYITAIKFPLSLTHVVYLWGGGRGKRLLHIPLAKCTHTSDSTTLYCAHFGEGCTLKSTGMKFAGGGATIKFDRNNVNSRYHPLVTKWRQIGKKGLLVHSKIRLIKKDIAKKTLTQRE